MLLYIFAALTAFLLLLTAGLSAEKRKMRRQLYTIASDLQHILDAESEERVMLFHEERETSFLLEQINRALESRQKTKADYKRSELRTRQMLANVSHDMKTPLTVILGYLEIMKLQKSSQTAVIEKVEKKAGQLMEMIGEFFTLAKIESGDISLSMEQIRIDLFCEEVIVDFYDILTEKEFQVEIRIPEQKLFVYADTKILKRILLNLITNALRYGEDGRFLGMEIRYDEHWIRVDISDKGKGIPAEEKERIFERLYRTDEGKAGTAAGSGLGLAIAKELAEKLGGNITFESEPHVRTVFTLELERAEQPA